MDSNHHLLVKLETLRSLPNFDPEDRALMMQYMIEVSNYEALLLLKENPVFLALIENFKKEIHGINSWILLNAKEITGSTQTPVKDKANYLIAKKETLQSFVEHYGASPVELISHIEDRANYFLQKYKLN